MKLLFYFFQDVQNGLRILMLVLRDGIKLFVYRSQNVINISYLNSSFGRFALFVKLRTNKRQIIAHCGNKLFLNGRIPLDSLVQNTVTLFKLYDILSDHTYRSVGSQNIHRVFNHRHVFAHFVYIKSGKRIGKYIQVASYIVAHLNQLVIYDIIRTFGTAFRLLTKESHVVDQTQSVI